MVTRPARLSARTTRAKHGGQLFGGRTSSPAERGTQTSPARQKKDDPGTTTPPRRMGGGDPRGRGRARRSPLTRQRTQARRSLAGWAGTPVAGPSADAGCAPLDGQLYLRYSRNGSMEVG